MGGMQMAQAAGAAISGGIFGGPEGFLGGAIGGITGGVGGAFVGAAAGAQVGMLRQQLGGFADYAAQIQKMEIALRNAAGSQDQFNQAMAAATSATQNLNVPQDIAIQGMTKLTAAVKGAGGQVSDAELVFRNVTSAIKATGGSAQDVDGAITAMVQVFSKGKVSAEELSGQLGERLPGAVTKFAKANDMTLPELQKALEQGQVGLNELMNFIVQLGDEYSGVAEKIAGSSQDAGARLTVAFNEMRIAVGEALQPIGAQFQEAFAEFIKDITPAVVAASKAIGQGIKFIADNAAQVGAIVELTTKIGLLVIGLNACKAAISAVMSLNLVNYLTVTATSAKITGDVMAVTAAKTGLLSAAIGKLKIATVALATAWGPALILTVGIVGAVATYNWIQKLKKSTDDLKQVTSETAFGDVWFKNMGGFASSNKVLGRKTSKALQQVTDLTKKLKGLEGEEKALSSLASNRLSADVAQQAQVELSAVRDQIKATTTQLYAQKRNAEVGMRELEARAKRGIDVTRDATSTTESDRFPSLTGDTTGKADKAAEKAAREAQQRFDEELQNLLQVEDFTLKKFALEEKIRLEQEKQGAIQAGKLDSEMQMAEIANQRLDLDVRATALAGENEKLENLRKQGLAEGLDVQKIAQKMQQNIIEDLGIQYENQKINTQEIKAQLDLEKEREKLNRALNQELEDRRYELGLITKEEYNRLRVERERRRLEEAYGGTPGAGARIETGVNLFRREIDPTFAEGLQSQLAIVRRELDDLTKPINQVVGAANAIGEAFSQSFASVINGSATTQEALASFFQNLANYFLDMAAQIIQKMIVMAILNQVVGLLPGSKGGGSFAGKGYFDPITGKGAAGPNFGLAMGGVVSKNGIEPFAMGGIVNKPTLFKYADGGTGRFGLMGEAGPEAIIPLKRGRDGRLGVSGGGSTNVTVNVDAQGTQVQGDDNRGQQLGRAVAAAVQAELIKQKRPGGLLA